MADTGCYRSPFMHKVLELPARSCALGDEEAQTGPDAHLPCFILPETQVSADLAAAGSSLGSPTTLLPPDWGAWPRGVSSPRLCEPVELLSPCPVFVWFGPGLRTREAGVPRCVTGSASGLSNPRRSLLSFLIFSRRGKGFDDAAFLGNQEWKCLLWVMELCV